MQSYAIVGGYHHPPALAIISVLPMGSELTLRPEPTNAFDPNAVQVLLPRTTLQRLNDRAKEALEQDLIGYGTDLTTVLERSEVMLGYIARKSAEELAPRLQGTDARAKLTYAADGKPQAEVEL